MVTNLLLCYQTGPQIADVNFINDGKRSIIIDLKSDAGVKVFRKLVANADVLIDPYRKGKSSKFLCIQ